MKAIWMKAVMHLLHMVQIFLIVVGRLKRPLACVCGARYPKWILHTACRRRTLRRSISVPNCPCGLCGGLLSASFLPREKQLGQTHQWPIKKGPCRRHSNAIFLRSRCCYHWGNEIESIKTSPKTFLSWKGQYDEGQPSFVSQTAFYWSCSKLR